MYGRAKRVHFEHEELTVAESPTTQPDRFSAMPLPSVDLDLTFFGLGDADSLRTGGNDTVSSAVNSSNKQDNILSENNASNFSFFTSPNSNFDRENCMSNIQNVLPSIKNVNPGNSIKNEFTRCSNCSSYSPHRILNDTASQYTDESFTTTKRLCNVGVERRDHSSTVQPPHNICKFSSKCNDTHTKNICNKKKMFCKVRKKDETCSCRMKVISNGLDEKRHAILKTNNEQLPEDHDKSINTSVLNGDKMDCESRNSETISDLCNIIKLQNKQLLGLQQRVDQLLETKKYETISTDDYVVEMKRNIEINKNKNPETRKNIEFEHIKEITNVSSRQTVDEVHKISIGVMTSFEMVMTGEENQTALNFKVNYADECVQTSNILNEKSINYNIEECIKKIKNANILDEQSDQKNDSGIKCEVLAGIKKPAMKIDENINFQMEKDDIDISCIAAESLILNLQQPQSPPITPPASLHLDIRDYSDSDSDDGLPSDTGWTFYNNVMNRVNNILYDPSRPEKLSTKSLKHRLQRDHRSQQKHDTVDVNTSKRVTFETQDLPYADKRSISEISIHMKKLALKYLGDNSKEQKIKNYRTARPINNVYSYKHGFLGDIAKEMSFSTLQYMQKHHLLSGNANLFPKAGKKTHQSAKACQYLKPARKILDITAIKRQPKLL